MKSIIHQEGGTCYLCNMLKLYCTHSYTEEHHIFYGTANRKKSEKYGLKVRLCKKHHRGDITGNREAVHFNKENDLALKQIGQAAFEQRWGSRQKFREEFGRSCL